MKRTLILLFTACLLAACGDDSEVFYSVSYPVVRVEAYVTVETPDPGPEPEPEPEPQPEPDPTAARAAAPTALAAPRTAAEEEPTEDPIIRMVSDDLLKNAPVAAGGVYRLDFTLYNGGPLEVTPAPGAETAAGVFVKQPGSRELEFFYGGSTYTYVTSTYTDEADNTTKVLLSADRTDYYKKMFPDAKLTRVVRREYTSQPSR